MEIPGVALCSILKIDVDGFFLYSSGFLRGCGFVMTMVVVVHFSEFLEVMDP
mgnify:CR=1 FL=1